MFPPVKPKGAVPGGQPHPLQQIRYEGRISAQTKSDRA